MSAERLAVKGGDPCSGQGDKDTDIIVASVKAYRAALNKMLVATGKYGQKEAAAVVAG
jgi:hypothetical protein